MYKYILKFIRCILTNFVPQIFNSNYIPTVFQAKLLYILLYILLSINECNGGSLGKMFQVYTIYAENYLMLNKFDLLILYLFIYFLHVSHVF